MIHPNSTLAQVSESIGLGVFATGLIKRGSIVFTPDKLDKVFPPNDPLIRNDAYQMYIEKYSFRDQFGNRVLSLDHAKYMNHSCAQNTISTAWGFDIAVRDIQKGEEMTCEYGLLNIERDMPCGCGSVSCRGIVRTDDIQRHFPIWDELIKEALEDFEWVDQPLRELVPDEVRTNFTKYLRTKQGFPSVLELALPHAYSNNTDIGSRSIPT